MDNFKKLGNQIERNIVNHIDVLSQLETFIENKNLQQHANVQKWINTVVKNYLLQKYEVEVVDKEDLSEQAQRLINEKKIAPPYHQVNITPQFKDKLSHCVDYLVSNFTSDKDISRISYEQSLMNADVWLKDRLSKLTTEEDVENVKLMSSFGKDGKTFNFVNVRSHKALQRESKIMNHCIETYWDNEYPQEKAVSSTTPYYLLRDEENHPIASLKTKNEIFVGGKGNILAQEDNFIINEIKQKNNAYLDHETRGLLDIFLKDKKIYMPSYEQSLSHYYHVHKDGEMSAYVKSINDIINNEEIFYVNNLLDIDDFKDYFPKEKLYKIANWKSLDLSQGDDFNKISAEKIVIRDVKDRTIHIYNTDNLKIINAENIKLTISDNEKKTQNKTRYRVYENVNNVEVSIEDVETKNTWYIFKNCENIKLNSTQEQNFFNVIKIDSKDVHFSSLTPNNTIELKSDNSFSYVSNAAENYRLEGNSDNGFCPNKTERNNFLKRALETYLKTFNSKDNIFSNFVNQLDVNVQQLIDTTSFKLNDCYFANSISDSFIKILRNTESTLQSIYTDKGAYKNYKEFVIENAYDILNEKKLQDFPDASSIISYPSENIKKTLCVFRETLIEVLNDNEDNFMPYFSSFYSARMRLVKQLQQMEEIMDEKTILSSSLFVYLLKNEILTTAINNYKDGNKTNERFSFVEKKIRNVNAKRWGDFFFSHQNNYQEKNKKDLIEIFASPLDDDSLLNEIKNCLVNKITDIRKNIEQKQDKIGYSI